MINSYLISEMLMFLFEIFMVLLLGDMSLYLFDALPDKHKITILTAQVGCNCSYLLRKPER